MNYENRQTIQISKNQIPELKKKSELLGILFSRNFKNSNNYYDNEGNFFLNRDILSEFTNEQWLGLRTAIEEGWVDDPTVRSFIKQFFIFNNDLTPPARTMYVEKGEYPRGKTRKQRKLMSRILRHNFNDNMNMNMNMNNSNNTENNYNNVNNMREELLKELGNRSNIENILKKINSSKKAQRYLSTKKYKNKKSNKSRKINNSKSKKNKTRKSK
jgi:hypothetical protein